MSSPLRFSPFIYRPETRWLKLETEKTRMLAESIVKASSCSRLSCFRRRRSSLRNGAQVNAIAPASAIVPAAHLLPTLILWYLGWLLETYGAVSASLARCRHTNTKPTSVHCLCAPMQFRRRAQVFNTGAKIDREFNIKRAQIRDSVVLPWQLIYYTEL